MVKVRPGARTFVYLTNGDASPRVLTRVTRVCYLHGWVLGAHVQVTAGYPFQYPLVTRFLIMLKS